MSSGQANWGLRILVVIGVVIALIVGFYAVTFKLVYPADRHTKATFSTSIAGYGPDLPGYVFVLVNMDANSWWKDKGPLQRTLVRDPNISYWRDGWTPDGAAMALLPENEAYLKNPHCRCRVTVVYQAPYDQLKGAYVRGPDAWNVPYHRLELGLDPLPPMPAASGLPPLPQTPVGTPIQLSNNQEVTVKRVRTSHLVGGVSSGDGGSWLAVDVNLAWPDTQEYGGLYNSDINLAVESGKLTPYTGLVTYFAQPDNPLLTWSSSRGTGTLVFLMADGAKPWLVVNDSGIQHRLALDVDKAEVVDQIAADQPVVPLGMAASANRLTCTVTGAAEVNSRTEVTVKLTADQGGPAWTGGTFGLLTADGRLLSLAFNDVSDSINDQPIAEGQTISGKLIFDGPAEGSYLIMYEFMRERAIRFALA